jgi:hypothetical protein
MRGSRGWNHGSQRSRCCHAFKAPAPQQADHRRWARTATRRPGAMCLSPSGRRATGSTVHAVPSRVPPKRRGVTSTCTAQIPTPKSVRQVRNTLHPSSSPPWHLQRRTVAFGSVCCGLGSSCQATRLRCPDLHGTRSTLRRYIQGTRQPLPTARQRMHRAPHTATHRAATCTDI